MQIFTNIKDSKIVIVTQSNSAANHIAERLIETGKYDPNVLVRLNSFSYKNRSINPVALKAFAKTLEDLLPDKDFNLFECLEQLKSYRIVVGTSMSIGKLLERGNFRNNFTHAIIDEAGQCTEMGVLIPMVLVGKAGQTIMAGDPMQMPPLVINAYANERGLSVSMLTRLLERYTNLGISVCYSLIFGR